MNTSIPVAPAVSNAVSSTPASNDVDINTLLTQLRSIEGEKESLMQQVTGLREKIGKLTEGKKQEMQKALDTVIEEWLKASVNDENVRAEFKKGMSNLVEQTAEDSGVWQVVCCASNVHRENLQRLEQVRIENENLRKNAVGQFTEENSRKRGREETLESNDQPKENMNVWDAFATSISQSHSLRDYEPRR